MRLWYHTICLTVVLAAAWRYLWVSLESTDYYIPSDPYPTVEVDKEHGKLTPKDQYHPGDDLIYKVDRIALVTTQATTTRRIVRKFDLNGQMAREPVFIFATQPNSRIDEGHILSFPKVRLPDDLSPGDYTLETSISFDVNGRLRTYTADSTLFHVVPK